MPTIHNAKPWERQPGESDKAFEAFSVRLEMGPKGSVRTVARKIGKNPTLIAKRWNWPSRVAAHIDFLTTKRASKAERRLPDIMSSAEVLARVSMLARATPIAVMNNDGTLMSVEELKKAGREYVVVAVKRRTTTYPNGTVTESTEYKVEHRAKYLELMGRHMGLWEEDQDLERAKRQLLETEIESRKRIAAGNGYVGES